MTVIKRNFIANLVGKIWAALASIVFIPLYIHFLGIEVFGLLGFLLSLQGLLALLDLGFSYAAAREFARRVRTKNEVESPDFLRTFEIVYWGMAVVVALSMIATAQFAGSWLNTRTLDVQQVHTAFMLFGVSLAMAWPSTLYSGGLSGLEHQVALNLINALATTFRNGGAVLVLWLISPTIEALLLWQAAVNLCFTMILRRALKKALPAYPVSPQFRVDLLKGTARYAAGVTGVLVLLTILSQMDKVLLARLLSLDHFGYYALASTVSLGLAYLGGPVSAVLFPRLVKAHEVGDADELSRLYHGGSQLIGLLVAPVGAVLALFPYELLQLWTRNDDIANHAAPVLSLLAVGVTLSMLVSLSYTLQAGAGWNRLVFHIHLASVVIMGVALWVVVPVWGPTGAAACWILLYLLHLLIGPVLMHRKLLIGQLGRWWREDILLPALSGVGVVFVGRLFIGAETVSISLLFWIGLVWVVAVLAQLLASNKLRPFAVRQMVFVYHDAFSSR